MDVIGFGKLRLEVPVGKKLIQLKNIFPLLLLPS
jgi:hypothetical protein